MRTFSIALAALCLATSASAQDATDLELWRLDCGFIELSDAAPFSDVHLYDGEPRSLTNSCYLVRNGDQYLLWDAGFSAELKGAAVTQSVFTVGVTATISEQLATLGLTAQDINLVAVSHYHSDHVGQLPEFANSTLIIGRADWEIVSQIGDDGAFLDRTPFQPWLGETSNDVIAFAGDYDVFGDGSTLIKAMPGHTPGHGALLVRLADSNDVLLTGDLYHFEEQIENRGVPQFNTDRAATLASFERFNATADALGAKIIIQHDPRHIARLPQFPESAK